MTDRFLDIVARLNPTERRRRLLHYRRMNAVEPLGARAARLLDMLEAMALEEARADRSFLKFMRRATGRAKARKSS